MQTVKRIDPAGCGCTDCLTGYSVPLDTATDSQVWNLVRGRLTDATGDDVKVRVTVQVGDRKVTRDLSKYDAVRMVI